MALGLCYFIGLWPCFCIFPPYPWLPLFYSFYGFGSSFIEEFKFMQDCRICLLTLSVCSRTHSMKKWLYLCRVLSHEQSLQTECTSGCRTQCYTKFTQFPSSLVYSVPIPLLSCPFQAFIWNSMAQPLIYLSFPFTPTQLYVLGDPDWVMAQFESRIHLSFLVLSISGPAFQLGQKYVQSLGRSCLPEGLGFSEVNSRGMHQHIVCQAEGPVQVHACACSLLCHVWEGGSYLSLNSFIFRRVIIIFGYGL